MFDIKITDFWIDKDGNKVFEIEATGDSTYEQPTEADVGGRIKDWSILIESDTGKVYAWNGKTQSWIEQFSVQA